MRTIIFILIYEDKNMDHIRISLFVLSLGVAVMLGQFFIDDKRPASKWRISGHNQKISMIIGGSGILFFGIISFLMGI